MTNGLRDRHSTCALPYYVTTRQMRQHPDESRATLIYKCMRNLRAAQLLLGHSKIESTIRYLGIEVDDALEISEQTEL